MEIYHDIAKHSVRTDVDGYTAYVEYEHSQETLDIKHTIVPSPIEGRGIASRLVRFTYDYALQKGLKPTATCSYAKAWLLRHPEYEK